MTDVMITVNGLNVRVPVEKILKDNCAYSYTVYYDRSSASELNALCDKYGSDKGEIRPDGHPYPWRSHSYADFIESRFMHCRDSVRHVFECGIGTNNPNRPSSMGAGGRPGASLRVWRDYFPHARIVGADIDREILFTEERISTYYVDQTKPESIAKLWSDVDVDAFDLMIDDGLHTFAAGRCLFEGSFHKLREGGLYVIEDANPVTLVKFKAWFAARSLGVEYINLYRPSLPLGDNSLIVIRK